MLALFRQIVLTGLFLAGAFYIVLVRNVAPNQPNFVMVLLVGCLSFVNAFWLLVITVGITRRVEWSRSKTRTGVVLEQTKQWLMALVLFLLTILFYTFLFRMGGIRAGSSDAASATHEAATCLYYAIINWVTAGYSNAISSPNAMMRLIISMEALAGGISMVALLAAIIAQLAAICRSAKLPAA